MIFPGEPHRPYLRVGDGCRIFTPLIQDLKKRLGGDTISVEDKPNLLAPIGEHHRYIASIVERFIDNLFQAQLVIELRLPSLLAVLFRHELAPLPESGATERRYSLPVSCALTVAANPFTDPNVALTAVASNPECTMQSWHLGLPLL